MPGSDADIAAFERFYEGRAVCVTGAAGFIGVHLTAALVELGARVSAIDDLSNSDGSRLADLVNRTPETLDFVYGSVLDARALAEAAADRELVFHLAAIGSVPRSLNDPNRTFEVNALGTVRVLEAARRAGAERLVLSSSSSVYGSSDASRPQRETDPTRPMSPYAASKLAAEHAAAAHARSFGLDAASLRYFNVFGPGQPAGSAYAAVVPAFAEALLAGRGGTVFGTGDQTRDFTPVDHVVRANLLAGARAEPIGGEPVNVGLGRRTSVLELHTMMARAAADEGPQAAPHPEPRFENARAGDVPHSSADTARARELLGLDPDAVDLEDALRRTVGWFRDRRDDRDRGVVFRMAEG